MYSERGGGYEIDLHKDLKISRKRPQDGHAKRRAMSKTLPSHVMTKTLKRYGVNPEPPATVRTCFSRMRQGAKNGRGSHTV